MKKILPLIIAAIFIPLLAVNILSALTPSALAQQAENNVGTTFTTAWVYESPDSGWLIFGYLGIHGLQALSSR